MPRYIDADNLKRYVNSVSTHWLNDWSTLGVLAAIDKMQTADVTEVKHGHWEYHGSDSILYCSCCGDSIPMGYEFLYCPNCGALMDGNIDKVGD